MTQERLAYIIIMFCAGIGIPLMAAMNARMGKLIGSPSASAMVLFATAFVIATLVTAATSGFAPLRALNTAPAYLFFGGLLIAFYLLSISWIAPRFGLGHAIFCVLIGQLAHPPPLIYSDCSAPLKNRCRFTVWRALPSWGLV